MTSLYTTLNIDLIDALGLQNLDPAEQQKLLAEMEGIISERILVTGMSNLTDDQLDEIDQIEDPEQLLGYLNSNVPNFEMLVAEEIAKFKEEMLNLNAIANQEIEKRFASE